MYISLNTALFSEEKQAPEKEIPGGIRLKLKVSGEVYSPLHETVSVSGEKRHKHKKKKKKKKAEKEKRRHAEASVKVSQFVHSILFMIFGIKVKSYDISNIF